MKTKVIFKWLTTGLIPIVIIACGVNQNIQLMNMKEITRFEVRGNEVYMSNLINAQTYDQFVKIIEENPQITTLVEEQIDGSIDDDTNIKLAYYVRKKGLNTKLLYYSDVNSGGVDLFLAGVERTMEKGAHIGIHSWYDGFKDAKEFPKDALEHEKYSKYTKDMLGREDFYWFTIYAAPANGIYEMSEKEIEKYGLLTKPIITKNLTKTNKIPGVLAKKFANIIIGNPDAKTVIVNLQGGPYTELYHDELYEVLVDEGGLDLAEVSIVNVHQEQTLKPWKFKQPITFEQAKQYDKNSVKYVADIIKFFKNKGKKVYVVGISFGAFVAQDLIAEYGNIADKYLIIVGRLNMPGKIWAEFAKGNYVGFEYDKKGNSKVIDFDIEQAGMGGSNSIEDQNMAKIAAGLGYKRYLTLLKDIDLSNVVYAYGQKDEQVGVLSKEEVKFLKLKGVKILTENSDHSGTIDNAIKQGISLLFDR